PCAESTNRSVDFDATKNAPSDYILLEPLDLRTIAPTKLGLTSFTIEFWFNRHGAGVTGTTGTGGLATVVPLVTKGRNETDVAAGGTIQDANYYVGLSINTSVSPPTAVLAADFEDTATSANHPVSGATLIQFGVWYHAAVTYDATTGLWRLYLNGNLEASPSPIGS